MIENIGAYSQVDYDRGYQQGRADAIKDFADWLVKYKVISDSAMHELIRDFKGEMG